MESHPAPMANKKPSSGACRGGLNLSNFYYLFPESCSCLTAHRDAGEGEYRQAGNRLPKATSGLEAAPQKQVFHLRSGGVVGGPETMR